MKILLSILTIFISFTIFGQTSYEQELYKNRIEKSYKDSKGTVVFVDSLDNKIGFKQEDDKEILYLDDRYRVIKRIPKSTYSKSNTRKIKKGVIRKRKKVEKYDDEGNLVFIAKKKKRGTIYYYDSDKDLIGYKRREGDELIYWDKYHRVTGKRILVEGHWVYYPEENRVTHSFLLENDFFALVGETN